MIRLTHFSPDQDLQIVRANVAEARQLLEQYEMQARIAFQMCDYSGDADNWLYLASLLRKATNNKPKEEDDETAG